MDKTPNRADEKFRHLYKATTPPWKETYRNRCMMRFKSARERLVDSFRCLPKEASSSSSVDMDTGILPQIIQEEWDNLQQEKAFGETDFIEEQEMIKNAIFKELMQEERGIASQYQEILNHENGLMEHHLTVDSDKVLCPVCQKNWLRQNVNIISCVCGLNVDIEEDALSLDYLKKQLQLGLTSHNNNCQFTPLFSQNNVMGMTNLISTCAVCGFMFIVI